MKEVPFIVMRISLGVSPHLRFFFKRFSKLFNRRQWGIKVFTINGIFIWLVEPWFMWEVVSIYSIMCIEALKAILQFLEVDSSSGVILTYSNQSKWVGVIYTTNDKLLFLWVTLTCSRAGKVVRGMFTIIVTLSQLVEPCSILYSKPWFLGFFVGSMSSMIPWCCFAKLVVSSYHAFATLWISFHTHLEGFGMVECLSHSCITICKYPSQFILHSILPIRWRMMTVCNGLKFCLCTASYDTNIITIFFNDRCRCPMQKASK